MAFKENKSFQGINLLWVPLCGSFVPVLNPVGQHENWSWGFHVRNQKQQSKNYVQNPICMFTHSLVEEKKKKNRRGERKKERKEEKGKNSTAASHP